MNSSIIKFKNESSQLDLKMSNVTFLNLATERFKIFWALMKEGYRFKDKLIILEYHLRSPLQFLNYLLGVKNSRNLRGDVFIKNRYGLFFCGDNFASLFGCCSVCEPVMRKYLLVKEGDIVIDAGANCGMFTIPFARMLKNTGVVIAIEPDKKNIELLKKNIKLNKLDNVRVIEKGCFSKKGEMTLYLDDFGTGGHSLLKKNVAEKEIIPVDNLDNILKNLKTNRVNFIKIDVMGVELETFKGARQILKRDHPKIIFELLNKEDKKEVYKFLSQYGYKIKQITDWNHFAI